MIRRNVRTGGIALLCGLLLTACGSGDSPAATQVAAEADAVRLIEGSALSPTAQALPRLAGDTPAIAAINADLDRIDALDAEGIADCQGEGQSWTRTVATPATGPAYVTFVVTQEYYCGGPYPATGQTAVTYDLASGQRVDWAAAIPGLNLTRDDIADLPAGYVGAVRSAALSQWYGARMLAGTEADLGDCREVYAVDRLDGTGFKIWLDAQAGGASVTPDFPHVIQACAETATLTADDLRGFDADPALIAAIPAGEAR